MTWEPFAKGEEILTKHAEKGVCRMGNYDLNFFWFVFWFFLFGINLPSNITSIDVRAEMFHREGGGGGARDGMCGPGQRQAEGG